MRSGSVAVRTWFGRRWRLALPGTLLGNQKGGFVFAHPLPPLGTLLTAQQFPLAISAEAFLVNAASGIPSAQSNKVWQFEDIKTIEAQGKKLRVNGLLFF